MIQNAARAGLALQDIIKSFRSATDEENNSVNNYIKEISRFYSGESFSEILERIYNKMTDVEFFKIVKANTVAYTNEHLDKSDNVSITEDDVYIVWYCKTLQNWKALTSTTLYDGMYYEFTLNGDKNELYMDAYKKFENKCICLGNN